MPEKFKEKYEKGEYIKDSLELSQEIVEKLGIHPSESKEVFSRLWENGIKTWGNLLALEDNNEAIEAAGGDEAGIAQVFYSRLALNMPLGSDVTYQYIADKLGVPRDPNLDSPYNTRKYTGLPPGPISTPGKAALLAVATPATTDYLYFLNGDDNVTYFSKTLDEHEANIKNHCQIKCQAL